MVGAADLMIDEIRLDILDVYAAIVAAYPLAWSHLHFRGNYGNWRIDVDKSLFALAWACLTANADLIRWSAFAVTGDISLGDRIINQIANETTTVLFTESPGRNTGADCNVGIRVSGIDSVEDMKVEPSGWNVYRMTYYEMEADGFSDFGSYVLLLMDLAGTLLHECVHLVCDQASQDDDYPENVCYPSYLIENMFRWAFLKRTPEIMDSTCFEEWTWGGDTVEQLYGYRNSVYLVGRCSPYSLS